MAGSNLFGNMDFDFLNRNPVDLFNNAGDAAAAALLAGGGLRGGIEGAIGSILGPKPYPSYHADIDGHRDESTLSRLTTPKTKHLNEFITITQNEFGMARTNRYTVDFGIPITIIHKDDQRYLSMFCSDVQIPGLNINTTTIRTFGETREIPYEFNYDPIQLSFIVTGDMLQKSIFDDWIKAIQVNGNKTKKNNRCFNYYESYISKQLDISVLDLNDKSRFIIHVYEAFPKNISSIQLGNDQKGIMKITLTLAYKHWVSEMVSDTQSKSNDVSSPNYHAVTPLADGGSVQNLYPDMGNEDANGVTT